jgi:hypothetical protein
MLTQLRGLPDRNGDLPDRFYIMGIMPYGERRERPLKCSNRMFKGYTGTAGAVTKRGTTVVVRIIIGHRGGQFVLDRFFGQWVSRIPAGHEAQQQDQHSHYGSDEAHGRKNRDLSHKCYWLLTGTGR